MGHARPCQVGAPQDAALHLAGIGKSGSAVPEEYSTQPPPLTRAEPPGGIARRTDHDRHRCGMLDRILRPGDNVRATRA
jgi:hypothetical protein